MRTSGGFNPNVYKSIKRFDYEFSRLKSLRLGIEAKSHGLNNTTQPTGQRYNT